ncbi:hypothetical protein TSAR_006929 [Trichomalopsis sarcophagae]|uniref:Uncharacterized protein n=1 Tax=Trichomalopsis sarcophagae TaxID=543379 RepID=A0A232ET89_9HYME|nr:hypothetical protein TSAR_006929 [Trichomalopsis sarcophagae]
MRFMVERFKDYFIDIEEILFNRHGKDHIKLSDIDDFDPKHLYNVTDDCTDKKQYANIRRNPERKLKTNMRNLVQGLPLKIKMMIVNQMTVVMMHRILKNKNPNFSNKIFKAARSEVKNIAKSVLTANTKRTIDEYKLQNFLKSRKKLNQKSGEKETKSQEFNVEDNSKKQNDDFVKKYNFNKVVEVVLNKLSCVPIETVKSFKSTETKNKLEVTLMTTLI